MFDSSNESMPRKTVLTKYNTRTYQVDGLIYAKDKTPKTYFFEWTMKTKAGLEKFKTNMIDYMLRIYKKQVTKPDQPLLFVNVKNPMGEAQTIYLIPEFCHEASLPDNFTQDKQKMRDIDGYKIKDPQDRFKRTCKLVNQIFASEEFKQWQIKLDNEMAKV